MYSNEPEYPSASETAQFWKKALRTYLNMLLYGGISTVAGYAVSFAIGLVLEYSYWKPEIAEYTGLLISLMLYPLLFGFKYVENCGYIDCYDEKFSTGRFFKQMLAATLLVLIVPMMVAASVNFLVIYVYNLCYGHTNGICELISQIFFHKYDGTTPLGIVIGTVASYAVYLPLSFPFYYLGRRHCVRDAEEGNKIKIKQ
jgi:hypothetical protein